MDTNVISALWSQEPTASGMAALLGNAHDRGGVVICGAVYAELLSHPKATRAFVDGFLRKTGVAVEFETSERVWREAARAYAAYAQRRRASGGSQPKRLLVDFVIGAHALYHADRLLTLDRSRYASDFPKLLLEPG